MTEGPVLVIVDPASTANELAVPRPTEGWAADAGEIAKAPLRITTAENAAATRLEAAKTRRGDRVLRWWDMRLRRLWASFERQAAEERKVRTGAAAMH
jgi:hypothetical protein